jgi:hypothetical protein
MLPDVSESNCVSVFLELPWIVLSGGRFDRVDSRNT